jgi:uncharacterized protein with PhoU and TrkA domain
VPRRTVKDLLTTAKDVSELMLDLAFAAVFFDDDELAREVIRLEGLMDAAVTELRILCMVAARSPEDAERLSGVLAMASSVEQIADAAEDIARVVLRDLGVPGELRDDLRHAQEVVARVKLRPGSRLVGASLRGLALPAETGMWVIAIRRGEDYEYGPGAETVLSEGDALLVQGPEEGVDLLRELAGGEPYRLGLPERPARLSNLDRAVDLLIELKNAAEAAVGLAYSAILFRDLGLVREVAALEDRCDDLYSDLQRWTLRAAAEVPDSELGELRTLLQIGASAESIADAARAMTSLAEGPEEPHPVVAAALAQTDEIVADALVTAQGAAAGRTLDELKLGTQTGMEVLAVQRGGRWLYRPRVTRTLAEGDRLLVIGPEEGVPRLRDLTGDVRAEIGVEA